MEKQDGLNQKRDVINNNKSICILTFSKIYKLQKYIGYGKGSICANNAMVETCPFGEKCVNRHESVVNHENSRSLVKGVKKLLTGDENYKKVNDFQTWFKTLSKATSKQSRNHTFLSLTNKRGSESKMISNYYDKIDGTVEGAST